MFKKRFLRFEFMDFRVNLQPHYLRGLRLKKYRTYLIYGVRQGQDYHIPNKHTDLYCKLRAFQKQRIRL